MDFRVKIIKFYIPIIYSFFQLIAQSNKIDSLKALINQLPHDTLKLKKQALIGELYRKNNQLDSATHYFNTALILAEKHKILKYSSQCYGAFGMIETYRTNYNLALQYHKKSLELKTRLHDNVGVSNSNNNIADVYYQQGKYAESLQYHFLALKQREQIGKNEQIANSLNNIGSVYNAQGKYNESIIFHEKALKIYEELKDNNRIAMCLNNLGINYNSLKNYSLAINSHQKAKELTKKDGNLKFLGTLTGNIGNCFYYLKDYTSAIENYNESLKIRTNINDKKGIAVCNFNLAKCYYELQEHNKSKDFVNKAIEINKQSGSINELSGNYLLSSKVNYDLKNYEQTYIDYKNYIKLRDSIFNLDNEKIILKAQMQYEFEKQEAINEAEFEKQRLIAENQLQKRNFIIEKSKADLIILEKENQLKNLTINKSQLELTKKEKEKDIITKTAANDNREKQVIIYLILGILTLTFLSTLIIIKALLSNKRKNKIINNSLIEKEFLLKEIHHRIKNNLQIVSSLLNLQSRYISDDKAASAINESKDRINAISILHKEIYKNEVLKEIDSKGYLTNLCSNLQNTFDPKNLSQIEFNLDPIMLDVDTLVPIGLIVNELITNSYKYGSTSPEPKIKLTLKQIDSKIILWIKDNGEGYPEKFDFTKNNSLGLKLIDLFSKKINAQLSFFNENGANTKLEFIKK
jgi:two-component sensor histidine kinase